MKILETKEWQDEERYEKTYKLDNNVTTDSLPEIIKAFEGEEYVMSSCRCETFDENDSPKHCEFLELEDVMKFLDYASNPSVQFMIDFNNKQTNEYAFCVHASTNYNYISYFASKKRRYAQGDR